jgi:sRNA-binding regulator protein Hfq
MPRQDYEVSSEGAVRKWDVPVNRLENAATVNFTDATALVSRINGTQMTGTLITMDGDMAIVDFTHSMVYKHAVRNIRTYYDGSAATFGVIAIGDPIFYDRSATMPAGVYLSTSPLDVDGNANPLFVFRVPANDADVAATSAAGASTEVIAVMQIAGD